MILAETAGKEICIQNEDIKERREYDTLVTPETLSEVDPLEGLDHPLAFCSRKSPMAT